MRERERKERKEVVLLNLLKRPRVPCGTRQWKKTNKTEKNSYKKIDYGYVYLISSSSMSVVRTMASASVHVRIHAEDARINVTEKESSSKV